MLPLDLLSGFFAICILLALTPGPDNIFVLTQSALSGRLAGVFVVLGLCTGVLVHSTAVALGVAAIVQTSSLAFNALKILGACYLLYLAWAVLRARPEPLDVTGPTAAAQKQKQHKADYFRLYRRGIIMNVTNPKVSIFFLSFLPQFADPARGSVAGQIFVLGGFFILSTLLIFGGIALLAGTIGTHLRNSARAQNIVNKIAGLVFIGLAIKLATLQQ